MGQYKACQLELKSRTLNLSCSNLKFSISHGSKTTPPQIIGHAQNQLPKIDCSYKYFFLSLFAALACDKGWLFHNKNCYQKFAEYVDWKNAVANCEKHVARLVKVDSKEENDFLLKHFLSRGSGEFFQESWIGLSYQDKDREFHWTDGTKPKYTNWGVGMPITSKLKGKSCCLIGNGVFWIGGPKFKGTWMDIECNFKMKYVCEKPHARK